MVKKTKRKEIREEINIPEDIKAEIDDDIIRLSKNTEILERKLIYPVIIKDKKIIIENKNPTKKDKKMIKTISAHMRNMIEGLEKKFVYKLQICSVHFPMDVSVQGNEIIIKNFLGETKERKLRIFPGVEVKIEEDIIIIESSDKEKAGQTAANIETITKIKKKDRRIFQDGIFIIKKEKGVRRKAGGK